MQLLYIADWKNHRAFLVASTISAVRVQGLIWAWDACVKTHLRIYERRDGPWNSRYIYSFSYSWLRLSCVVNNFYKNIHSEASLWLRLTAKNVISLEVRKYLVWCCFLNYRFPWFLSKISKSANYLRSCRSFGTVTRKNKRKNYDVTFEKVRWFFFIREEPKSTKGSVTVNLGLVGIKYKNPCWEYVTFPRK